MQTPAATPLCGTDLAVLLEYPEGTGAEPLAIPAARTLAAELQPSLPRVAELLGRFADALEDVASDRPGGAQELYVSTFELNSLTHLYAGVHLLGESQRRNALLVGLRQAASRQGGRRDPDGSDRNLELPDHLPFLFRLLDRLPEDEAAELVQVLLLPALQIIGGRFSTEDGKPNPYSFAVQAVREMLAARFPERNS